MRTELVQDKFGTDPRCNGCTNRITNPGKGTDSMLIQFFDLFFSGSEQNPDYPCSAARIKCLSGKQDSPLFSNLNGVNICDRYSTTLAQKLRTARTSLAETFQKATKSFLTLYLP